MAKTVVKNLSKSKGITRETYSPGIYHFEVKGGEERESKSGNTMFVHDLKILEGPEFPSGRESTGGKFTAYFPITESEFTVDKLKDFVNALGIRIGSDDGYDPAKAIGKSFWGQLSLGTGAQGTPQANLSKCYSEEEYAEKQSES